MPGGWGEFLCGACGYRKASAFTTLVAFANTAGGILIVGVEDGSRRVRGVPDVLAAEERLASLVSDSINPRLVPDMEILPWRKTHLLVAQVYPSQSRPHHLERLGPEAGVFVRVGSTNRRAGRSQLDEMRRMARFESFDEQPLPDLSPEALDFRAASELFAPVRRLPRTAFRTLRITSDFQGREVPSVGGYLLFARDRFQHFPDAWIQAGRFAGIDRTHLVDSVEIRSLLPRAVGEAIEFVQKHLIRAVITNIRRVDRWTIPVVALREAIVNAVVHADYAQQGSRIRVAVFDDRVEIQSPGLLPLGLTVEDIQQGVSKLRNRVIGRVFHELGLIEQWGSGIQRMTSACEQAGLDPPRLEETGNHFRVTIAAIPRRPASLDEKESAILALLADGQGHSTAEIAAAISLSARATRTRLAGLVERGAVAEVASSPSDPRKMYYLA